MKTFLCNINGKLSHKRGRSAEALRDRIRATLLKQFGRYDDKRIDIKLVRNPTREINSNENAQPTGNAISRVKITDQLRHI